MKLLTISSAILDGVSTLSHDFEQDCSDLGAKECWDHVRDTTLAAATQAFGKTKTKSQDWFDANIATLQPLIEAKRNLLLEHQKNPTTETLAALRLARSQELQNTEPI